MKNFFLILISFGLLFQAKAQNEIKPADPSASKMLEGANQLKTMDRQQVLTNYLQAVASNLTSNSKAVQLKASLFALNSKDSVDKYLSDYYLHHHFQRNFQLMAGGGLDKNSNINSYSAGFAYNILNHRDLSEIPVFIKLVNDYNQQIPVIEDKLDNIEQNALKDYRETKFDAVINAIIDEARKKFNGNSSADFENDLINILQLPRNSLSVDAKYKTTYQTVEADLKNSIVSHHFNLSIAPQSTIWYLADYITTIYFLVPFNAALSDYISGASKTGKAPKLTSSAALDPDFKHMIDRIDKEIAANQVLLNGKNLVEANYFIQTEFDRTSNHLAEQSQLTFSTNFSHAKTGIRNQLTPAMEFLIGVGKKDSRRFWEVSLTASDTLSTDTSKKNNTSLDRNLATFQAGINRILFTDKNNVSLLEAKIALEGDHIFSGLQKDEKTNKAFASLIVQGRPSTKSPWFKLGAKYNKKASFLGFLDVTLNLDSGSNKGS